MNITKDNLCDLVYKSLNDSLIYREQSTEFPHYRIAAIIDETFFAMSQQLKNQHSIEIRGFGRFSVQESKVKKGRNFRTDTTIVIPAKNRIKFKASPSLYEPPATKMTCENERDCLTRISTTVKKDGCPIRMCRYYYRCPSRTQDIFQNDPFFSQKAKVLYLTTGKLVRATHDETIPIAEFEMPVVILHCETKVDSQKVKIPEDFILTFRRDSVRPNFNSGPAIISFNYRNGKLYVRNSHLDFEYDIEPVFRNDVILTILLNAKFK